MKNQIIIALGREHGSGGHYIADMIAKEFGIKLYDKDSIETEIVSDGYSEELIRKMDEKPVNLPRRKVLQFAGSQRGGEDLCHAAQQGGKRRELSDHWPLRRAGAQG